MVRLPLPPPPPLLLLRVHTNLRNVDSIPSNVTEVFAETSESFPRRFPRSFRVAFGFSRAFGFRGAFAASFFAEPWPQSLFCGAFRGEHSAELSRSLRRAFVFSRAFGFSRSLRQDSRGASGGSAILWWRCLTAGVAEPTMYAHFKKQNPAQGGKP
jgi:hypothetical protein